MYIPPYVCIQNISLLSLNSYGKGVARDFKQTQLWRTTIFCFFYIRKSFIKMQKKEDYHTNRIRCPWGHANQISVQDMHNNYTTHSVTCYVWNCSKMHISILLLLRMNHIRFNRLVQFDFKHRVYNHIGDENERVIEKDVISFLSFFW